MSTKTIPITGWSATLNLDALFDKTIGPFQTGDLGEGWYWEARWNVIHRHIEMMTDALDKIPSVGLVMIDHANWLTVELTDLDNDLIPYQAIIDEFNRTAADIKAALVKLDDDLRADGEEIPQ